MSNVEIVKDAYEAFAGGNIPAVPEEFLDAGTTVVAPGNYSGTYKAIGENTRVPFARVWSLRDDKIFKFVQYTDTLKVSEAL